MYGIVRVASRGAAGLGARHYVDLRGLFVAAWRIMVRTSRFQPGCDLSNAAVAQPRASQSPRATPGERLTPMLQCTITRSASGHLSRNSVIAPAWSCAKRMSDGSPRCVTSSKWSLNTATNRAETLAGSASGSEIEMQISLRLGSYRSASSRDSTTSSGADFAVDARRPSALPRTYFA